MMSLVLQRLEQLQANLAVVDPANEAEAADAIAAIAISVRQTLADHVFGNEPRDEIRRHSMQVAG